MAKPKLTTAEYKKRRFLEELAAGGNVTKAGAAAGISSTHVYRLRRRDAAFRDGWDEALGEAYARIEAMLVERVIEGIDRPIIYGGEVTAHVREYSDRTALALLAAHRASVKGGRRVETYDEMRDAIDAEVAAIGERLKAGDDDVAA